MGTSRRKRICGPRPNADIVWVVLIAFLVRALIPTGWMPSGETGAVGSIVLCTNDGAQIVQVDAAGAPLEKSGSPSNPSRSGDHQVCPFAGLGVAAPGKDVLAFNAPRGLGLGAAAGRFTDASTIRTQIRLAEARAPPFHI